jgi:hypothetical protein
MKGDEGMKIKTSLLAALLFVGGFAAHGGAEVISRTELTPGNDYCHLRFPAITEQTLTSDRPALKGSESGDIIDFYGKCDESPTGANQIASQRRQKRSNKDARD